jgi:hypothetical protein
MGDSLVIIRKNKNWRTSTDECLGRLQKQLKINSRRETERNKLALESDSPPGRNVSHPNAEADPNTDILASKSSELESKQKKKTADRAV